VDTPVWELRTDLDLDAVNLHLAALQAAGLLGVAEEGGRATVYLPRRVDDLPIAGTWAVAEERDWLEEWKRGLEPVTVGALTVTPPWFPRDADAIVITPSYAFGTGHHETTAACLAALQELDLAGRSVLDVGTGSAILAIAAARLGATPVVGVDIDGLALESAADNVRANAVEVDLRHGSLDQVEGRFDVVLANLDTDTHKALAPALVAHLAAGGTLIASGIAVPRTAEAVAAFTTAGLPPQPRHGHEWTLLTARRP
jgi:ribosomal protein L11 methyltransferase